MKLNRSDITVVLRSSGERTVPVTWNLLGSQVSEDQLIEINEVPNSRALRVAYQIALEKNREWILLIDGDILPFRSMIDRMLQIAENIDKRVFCIQCNNLDKMMRYPRPSGIHMYRTSLIEKALNYIPKENRTMRPESTTMSRMEQNGYPTLFVNEVLALHDFEQYYKDFYRKGYFCAHKFTDEIPYLKRIWKQLESENKDYKVLLEGLERGQSYNGLVVSNVDNFEELNIPQLLIEMGISEKKALDASQIDFEYIDEIFNKFTIPVEYYNSIIFSKLNSKKDTIPPVKRRFLQLKGKLGIWKLGPWIIANYFEKLGRFIKLRLEG